MCLPLGFGKRSGLFQFVLWPVLAEPELMPRRWVSRCGSVIWFYSHSGVVIGRGAHEFHAGSSALRFPMHQRTYRRRI